MLTQILIFFGFWVRLYFFHLGRLIISYSPFGIRLLILYFYFLFVLLFNLNLDLYWFFEFFVFLDFTKLWIKRNLARVIGQKSPEVGLLEKFPLDFKCSVDIGLIFLIIFHKLVLSKVHLLILAAHGIELISWNRNIVYNYVIICF